MEPTPRPTDRPVYEADTNAFLDAADSGDAAIDEPFTAPDDEDEQAEFDTLAGLSLTATIGVTMASKKETRSPDGSCFGSNDSHPSPRSLTLRLYRFNPFSHKASTHT